jgi:hypothetical protein
MRNRFICGIIHATFVVAALFGQTPAPAPRNVLGTVNSWDAAAAAFDVKPDSGAVVHVKIAPATAVRLIAAGQTDLAKAETISATDIRTGDRVLVTFGAPDPDEARRIIVIAASDIARRDAADRADWQNRGVAGVVTAISGSDIAVELRSLNGATKFAVTTSPKTIFRRYASDSTRFADARPGAIADISAGDQLRARGIRSADGLHLDAEEIISGTFLSKAGRITSVNPAAREIVMKDLATNKPVTVQFTADARLRRMPDQGPAAGRGPAPPPSSAGPAGANAGAPRGPDLGQILDRLPQLKVDDLKPGEVIVLSGMRGTTPDRITAVTFVANAEALVQLAMAARGAGATGPAPSLAGLASSISTVGP